MSANKFEKPWQVLPTRVISLALEHAQQKTDFDHQLAFLLLDVGVETTLKTYLINKRQDVEHIGYPVLVERCEEELRKDKLQVPLDEVVYFHKIRNKLYHQGDGVKPTDENLSKYGELAKQILRVLLDIEVELPSEQDNIHSEYFQLVKRFRKNLISMEINAALMAEVLRPDLSFRKMEAQLRYVREIYGPDDDTELLSTRAEVVQIRINKVNEITGLKFTEKYSELIEYILDYPEYLYVWLALQKMEKRDWRDDLYQHRSVIEFLRREFSEGSWAGGKFYEKLDDWAFSTAQKIYDWVKANIPDVTPKDYEYSSLANQSIDWNLILSDASDE